MLDEALVLRPYRAGSASIDVDVVSWNVPIPLLSTVTWGPGMPAYNWQAMAASGMSVDGWGALNAVKVMALAAVQLYRASQAVAAAKDGFSARVRRGLHLPAATAAYGTAAGLPTQLCGLNGDGGALLDGCHDLQRCKLITHRGGL